MAAKRRKTNLSGSLGDAVGAVGKALSLMPTAGMLIGGIAVIARGVPRTTRDVDITIAGDAVSLESLLEEFAHYDIEPRIADAIAFAHENQVLLLRHGPSGIDVDVSLAWLPFELDAITAAEKVLLAGVRIRVARPEDLVIYKAVAWRPQDQQDVERLLTIYAKQMNLDRVRRVVAEFAAALDDPERCVALEQVIRRVLG